MISWRWNGQLNTDLCGIMASLMVQLEGVSPCKNDLEDVGIDRHQEVVVVLEAVGAFRHLLRIALIWREQGIVVFMLGVVAEMAGKITMAGDVLLEKKAMF